MKSTEFNALMEAQIERSRNVLAAKAGEYASDEDRLRNFKQAADLQEETQREALAGMMVKHTVSLYEMIRDPEALPMELWEEKITDHINYLILLNAVIKDEELERKGITDILTNGVPEPPKARELSEVPDTPAELTSPSSQAR